MGQAHVRPHLYVEVVGTVIDFQGRRELRRAGAADPFERLRTAVSRLDPLVRALDARSFDAGVAAEALHQIQAQLDIHRVEEAATHAEDLLRRMESRATG
jgi:hypothetical protein